MLNQLIQTAPQAPATASPANDDLVIDVSGLTKRYEHLVAVGDLDLRVRAGRVTGFVGPNGAGKTTTIRMLLGLVAPSAGSGSVLGSSISEPAAYLPRVGAMIEGPAFHPGLPARANLRSLAVLANVTDAEVDRLLGVVGLADRADDRAGSFSLGMKQRLGIAAALLGSPDLLILDEPTNGLDPAGIREVRGLLRELARGGTTVLVSSHLLSEIETICDDVVVLRKGRLLFSGTVEALLAHAKPAIVARPERADDLDRLLDVAAAAGHRASIDGDAVRIDAPDAIAADLNRRAQDAGVTLVELREDRVDLEEVFFSITEGQEVR
jgi:ABC-2 type transport system ATP-binding protein